MEIVADWGGKKQSQFKANFETTIAIFLAPPGMHR